MMDLLRARKACQYPDGEQVPDAAVQHSSDDTLEQIQLVFDLNVQLENLRTQHADQETKSWQVGLDLEHRLNCLSSLVRFILDNEDIVLAILRQPVAENSLNLRLQFHEPLISAFELLKSLVNSKELHQSNAEWVANQSWKEFVSNLDTIEPRLMKLEASIAQRVQEMKSHQQHLNKD